MVVPRDTSTGRVLEEMVLPALINGGYEHQSQVNVGERLGGGRHRVDVVATDKEGNRYLISLKWQQVAGTAEQKVPFEAMCLAQTVMDSGSEYDKAYIVLGGDGWKLREFYVSGGLQDHLRYADCVDIVKLETFVARANKGEL